MMGGWREMLVNELQVTPLFRLPALVVTTTTGEMGEGRYILCWDIRCQVLALTC